MPSKSPEQASLMRAVAHGWKKPGGGGPSQAVGKEFLEADRRKDVEEQYEKSKKKLRESIRIKLSKPKKGGKPKRIRRK